VQSAFDALTPKTKVHLRNRGLLDDGGRTSRVRPAIRVSVMDGFARETKAHMEGRERPRAAW
jgi:hypothetical protein